MRLAQPEKEIEEPETESYRGSQAKRPGQGREEIKPDGKMQPSSEDAKQ